MTPHGFDVPPRRGLTLSVVVPVYNERRYLPRLLRAVMLALPGVEREIVLVDDGSTDGTREWINSAFPADANRVTGVRRVEDGGIDFLTADAALVGPEDGCEKVAGTVTVRPLMHETNAGKGRAVRTALEAATGEDLVYVTDFGDWYGPGSAGNINHLSADGAIAFTDQLWGMPEFRDRVIDALAPTEGAGG